MAAIFHATLRRLAAVPPAYYVFAVLVLVLWFTRPQLFNLNVMGVFIRQVAPLGIVVLGQLLVMNVRSIDLSAGGIILLVNYYISSGMFGAAGPELLVPVSIATGLGVGLFNGMMVGIRRASAVIVTLGVSIVLIGIVQFLANGKPPGNVPQVFNAAYNAKLFAVPLPILAWIALTALMAVFLSRFVFGRFVAAVGDNPVAAHFSGVPVRRTVIAAHTISGLMAALAGLVQTASIAVGSIRFGLDLSLNAVAAAILGGVIFGRGEGGVWGPFFGVLSFALLFVVMTTLGIKEPGKLVAQGLIILLAATLYGLRRANA
ncbi:ABC transporter permease [Marinibaculum pumilum]|uniref:ABC transporter permease n=1 Tax=Marinibaculum pumilum TaxID=1766165 RepID=A0ABV7KTI4_9PROT